MNYAMSISPCNYTPCNSTWTCLECTTLGSHNAGLGIYTEHTELVPIPEIIVNYNFCLVLDLTEKLTYGAGPLVTN